MVDVTPAHFVGAQRITPDAHIIEPKSMGERLRLWWMARRGAVFALGRVNGKPTYLDLLGHTAAKPKPQQ